VAACNIVGTTPKVEPLVRTKEVGLKGNGDKTKYTFMSHEQNAVHNHDMKVTFNVVAKFRYLE
jgi:hypothetical protein